MQLNNEGQFVTAKWVGLYGGKRSLFIESYSHFGLFLPFHQ